MNQDLNVLVIFRRFPPEIKNIMHSKIGQDSSGFMQVIENVAVTKVKRNYWK